MQWDVIATYIGSKKYFDAGSEEEHKDASDQRDQTSQDGLFITDTIDTGCTDNRAAVDSRISVREAHGGKYTVNRMKNSHHPADSGRIAESRLPCAGNLVGHRDLTIRAKLFPEGLHPKKV